MPTTIENKRIISKNALSVFLFDDKEDFTKNFARILRSNGLRVHYTTKVNRAKRLIKNEPFDIYLIDVQTDEDNKFGLRLSKMARELNNNGFIELISANPDFKDKVEEVGANHFTQKPIINFNEYVQSIVHSAETDLDLRSSFKSKNITSLDKLIIGTVDKLERSPETRKILLELFGKELPQIKERVDEFNALASKAKRYLKRADKMQNLKEALRKELEYE